jgi:hypothetical protein
MIRQHQLSICQSRLIVGLELSQERRARHLGYRERGTCGAVVSIRLRSDVRPNEGRRRRRGSMSLSITEKGSGGVYDGGEKYSRAATMTLLSLVARGGLMYSRAICFVLGIPDDLCAPPTEHLPIMATNTRHPSDQENSCGRYWYAISLSDDLGGLVPRPLILHDFILIKMVSQIQIEIMKKSEVKGPGDTLHQKFKSPPES